MNSIDPDGEIFKARLYRQHCLKVGGYFLKDLRLIAKDGIRLDRTVLIDNSLLSFAINMDHGVSIPDFNGENIDPEEDKEIVFAA